MESLLSNKIHSSEFTNELLEYKLEIRLGEIWIIEDNVVGNEQSFTLCRDVV